MKYFIITWIISFGISVDCPTERVFDPVTQDYKTPHFVHAVNCMEIVSDTLSIRFETEEDYLRHIELLQSDNRVKSIQVEEVQSVVVKEWARPKPKNVFETEVWINDASQVTPISSIQLTPGKQ
ncbi:hypothetical protein [Lewinella sp. W8]|uniref:hypothetical protein n=1 Tax=Lewinella sp. W8 TaxID=2528208 RepID=UPI00106840E8|nr:hypothetical protein [Lewinella sp. W8]MTB53047.1 hypothetical protein [Lewinella sp. W8]